MLALILIALIKTYLNAFKKLNAKLSLLVKKYIYKIITSLFNNNIFKH